MNDLKIQFSYSRYQYVKTATLGVMLAHFRSKTTCAILITTAFLLVYSPGKDLVQGMIEGAGLMVLLALSVSLFFAYKVNDIYKSNSKYWAPYQVSLESGGLRWTGGEPCFLEWSLLDKPIPLLGNIFLFQKTLCVFLPRHAFKNDADFQFWKSTIDEKITSKESK